MNTSDETAELFKALALANTLISNPKKLANNPHFKSDYADLATTLNSIRSAFAMQGLSVVQATYVQGDMICLETRVVHASGQWMASDYPVCRTVERAQTVGSALTYARRYSLSAMVGVAGDDDDDGNAASKVTSSETAAKSGEPVYISEGDFAEIMELINDTNTNQPLFMKAFSINKIDELRAVDLSRALNMLYAKLNKQNGEKIEKGTDHVA